LQVLIGKIVNTQGLKGEVKILSNSDFKKERFKIGNKLEIKTRRDTYVVTIAKYYTHRNFDIVKFSEFNYIDEVEKFKNAKIYAEKMKHSDLKDGEYFFEDLEGCTLINEEGIEKGIVKEVIENPAHLLLRVKYKKNYLLPFNKTFISNVNIDEKKIIFKEMKGLIDED